MTATDLYGPTLGAGGVTSRPTETRAFTATDTFFKDCSAPDVDDGTEFDAAWFNQVTAALRAIARGNGQTGGGADIVSQDNSDDLLLLKALQHLIQRGQPTYGTDTSTAVNVVTAALSPAPPELKTGMTVRLKMANDCTGASALNLNALGIHAIVRKPGSQPTVGGEWKAGDIIDFEFDGTNWQGLGLSVRPPLAANTTVYVNGTTGSDTANDGSAATVSGTHGPFKTIGRAMAYATAFGPSAYAITIQVAAGTYNEQVFTPLYAIPNIILNGAGIGLTLIDGGTIGNAVCCQGPNTMTVTNLKGQNNAAPLVPIFLARASGNLTTANTASGSSQGAVFQAYGGTLIPGTHSFSGNSNSLFAANYGGSIGINSNAGVFTVTTNITVFTAAATASADGAIGIGTPSTPTWVLSGSVTGARYQCTAAGGIDASGNGVNYFPGSSAGTASSTSYGWYLP